MNIRKVPVRELQVDWSLNPRKRLDMGVFNRYVEDMEGYIEEGEDINTVWKQSVISTQDLVVIQGCHTVTALKQVDQSYILNVEILDVVSTDVAETRFYAAQSNVHGKQLTGAEKRLAIRWILEGSNLKKVHKDPNKKPYMTNEKIGAMLQCSKETVRKIRNELLGKPTKIYEPPSRKGAFDETSILANIDLSDVKVIRQVELAIQLSNNRNKLVSRILDICRKDYMKSSAWKSKRESILSDANYACVGCGAEATVVHHVRYDNLFVEKPEDLQALCAGCHARQHPEKI